MIPALLVVVYAVSCTSNDQPAAPGAASQPSTLSAARNEPPHAASQSPPAAATPARNPILAESADWTEEEALANLGDPKLGLSAAVRLARLGSVPVSLLPASLSAEAAAQLRLVELGEGLFALGRRDAESERRLHAVILINADGNLSFTDTSASAAAALGGDDSERVLFISRDADVFPHLLISRKFVLLATTDLEQPALKLKAPDSLRFELRTESLHDHLALVLNPGAAPGPSGVGAESGKVPPESAKPAPGSTEGQPEVVEVARYNWDPFEAMFQGPVADRLPDPPGGRFELDVEQSSRLQPVGGEIEAPDPVKSPERDRKEPS